MGCRTVGLAGYQGRRVASAWQLQMLRGITSITRSDTRGRPPARSRTHQDASYTPQDASCTRQDVSCALQDVSCALRDASCTPRDASCAPQDAPCALQDASCRPQDASCAPQDAPCVLQDASCTPQDASCGPQGAPCAPQDAPHGRGPGRSPGSAGKHATSEPWEPRWRARTRCSSAHNGRFRGPRPGQCHRQNTMNSFEIDPRTRGRAIRTHHMPVGENFPPTATWVFQSADPFTFDENQLQTRETMICGSGWNASEAAEGNVLPDDPMGGSSLICIFHVTSCS